MSNGTVILLGIDTPIGLSIIRELGESGVSVIGLGSRANSLARYSRYISRAHVRASGEQALVEQIASLALLHRADALIAISESDMQLLNRNRHALCSVRLLIPEADVLDLALNKRKTYDLARELGIDIPSTISIPSVSEFEAGKYLKDLQFPVVLKWPDPQSVAAQLRANKLELMKAEYAYTTDELAQKLARYVTLGKFPIIQSFCPGLGLGQFFLIHKGKVIQRFQHKRVHEWPPEGGFSSLCTAVPINQHAELMKKSEQLLLKMGWEGVAMVEYRYSAETGRSYLMEVNGRFWGSLPLAYHCGARFALLLFRILGQGQNPEVLAPRDDLQCRYMIPETKRLMRVIAGPAKITDRSFIRRPWLDVTTYLLGFLNPRMRYFLFMWRDPLPFFADLRAVMVKALKS